MKDDQWRAELDALLRVWQGRKGGERKIITTIITRIAVAAARACGDARWALERIRELEKRVSDLESARSK